LQVVTFDGRVSGVEPTSGRVVWEEQVDSSNPASLVLADGAVYVASLQKVACLRYPTGELVWSTETHVAGRATILLAGDRLFVASAGEVECFSLEGESLWYDASKSKGAGPMGVPNKVA
jgi:outer membrane protein assembly factor BamB